MEKELSNSEKDRISEVINIAVGNSSTALSKLIDRKVTVSAPDFIIESVEKAANFLGETDKIKTVVLLKVMGAAPGMVFLMFDPESALKLAGILNKNRKKDIKMLDETDRSALREAGNILSGASISAVSNFLGFDSGQSVPEAVTDMLGSVADSILLEAGKESDVILVFKADFKAEKEGIETQMFYIFDPKSTDKILEKVREKVEKNEENH